MIKKTESSVDHILVDEAQDLTRMQLKILSCYLKTRLLRFLAISTKLQNQLHSETGMA